LLYSLLIEATVRDRDDPVAVVRDAGVMGDDLLPEMGIEREPELVEELISARAPCASAVLLVGEFGDDTRSTRLPGMLQGWCKQYTANKMPLATQSRFPNTPCVRGNNPAQEQLFADHRVEDTEHDDHCVPAPRSAEERFPVVGSDELLAHRATATIAVVVVAPASRESRGEGDRDGKRPRPRCAHGAESSGRVQHSIIRRR
jgi:hypothetical protein